MKKIKKFIEKNKRIIIICLILIFFILVINMKFIKDLIVFAILCIILYSIFFNEGFGNGND